jgi:hypothetical protein
VGYDVLRMAMAKCRDVVGRSRQHAFTYLLYSSRNVFTNAGVGLSIASHQHSVLTHAAHQGVAVLPRCDPTVVRDRRGKRAPTKKE